MWLCGLRADLGTEVSDSWSGHMPGFWVGSPDGGAHEATDGCFSSSLSPSLLSKNKL